MVSPLPIDPVLPELVAAVRAGNAVLHAPTGAGKTTRVPPALLKAGAVDGVILMLEPRRVAARAAAQRMADELGEALGETVGFQVRFERKASARTRILVVTEGVLLRRLVSDPFLEGVGAVVLDEFHERSLDADLSLAMVRHLQRELRPELRIVVMSATLDVERVSAFVDGTVVRSEGRAFPVEVRYLPRPDDRRLEERVVDGVHAALAAVDGDVLVFLPGAGEIRWVQDALRLSDVDVVPLHGRLPPAEQDAALRSGPRRRVVLSTNVAETSVTIPGVRAVVDVGQVRVLRHDPQRGLDRLVVESNSRASADQRAGRAGRVAPGICFRLWTEAAQAARPAHDDPEIRRVDLAGPVITLLAWGEPDARKFPWFDAPQPHALEAAIEQLRMLGALDAHDALSATGKAMAAIPAQPRLARLLLEGHRRGALREAAEAAALLSERLPFKREGFVRHVSDSDVGDLLDALDRGSAHGWRATSPGVAFRTRESADQLVRATERVLGAASRGGGREGLDRALCVAWPDRVAKRRVEGGDRVLLANGRGAKLHPDSAVKAAPWLVAVEVTDGEGAEADVRLAAQIDPSWLDAPDRLEVTWDADKDRVVTAKRARWGAIILREHLGVQVPQELVTAALVEAIRASPDRAIPWDDPDTACTIGRLRFAAKARPDLNLPASDAEGLLEVAATLTSGARSLADVRRANWTGALLDALSWEQKKALDTLAPERFTVPSGSAIRLDYPDDGAPVLAVRIQELYGATQTPRVGHTAIQLQLLSPNNRIQQVTDDLPGFWDRAYVEIRKELRARYPRHSWPDDPRTAPAEHRPRRRT